MPNVALSRRAADDAMIRGRRYVRTVGLNAWLAFIAKHAKKFSSA
jgi:hypothetical protein